MTHTEEICLHRVSLERAVSFFQEEPSDAEEIVSLVLGEPGFCRFDDQDFGLLIDALQTTTNIIYSVRIYAGRIGTIAKPSYNGTTLPRHGDFSGVEEPRSSQRMLHAKSYTHTHGCEEARDL